MYIFYIFIMKGIFRFCKMGFNTKILILNKLLLLDFIFKIFLSFISKFHSIWCKLF